MKMKKSVVVSQAHRKVNAQPEMGTPRMAGGEKGEKG